MRTTPLIIFSVLLSACAANSNIDEPADTIVMETWTPAVPPGKATLVVVNPFVSECCGATAGYEVTVRGSGAAFRNDDLFPVDDFYCLHLSPGEYTASLRFKYKDRAEQEIPVALAPGQVAFAAAEVDVRRRKTGPVGKMYLLPSKKGMNYVNRALNRWQRTGLSPGFIQRRLSCPAPKP